MRAASQTPANQYTALILKSTGIILILIVLVNYAVLSIPFSFSNERTIDLISQWVNQGVVPLLGMALIGLGIWVGRFSSLEPSGKSSDQGVVLAILLLSLMLGGIFLSFIPLSIYSTSLAAATGGKAVKQQTDVEMQQLEATLAQQKARIGALIQNDQQVAQLQEELNNPQLPAEQQAQLKQLKETLQKVRANPTLLDQELEKSRLQEVEQIKQREQEALKQLVSQGRTAMSQAIAGCAVLLLGYLAVVGICVSFFLSLRG